MFSEDVVAIKAIVGDKYMRTGYDAENPLPSDLHFSHKLLRCFDIVEFYAYSGKTTELKNRFRTPIADFTPENVAIVRLVNRMYVQLPSGLAAAKMDEVNARIENALSDIPDYVLHPVTSIF